MKAAFMRKILSSLMICFSIYSTPAFAIRGEGAIESNPIHFASTCDIEIPSDSFDATFKGCTGTLISPNEIVTAGHCFPRKFSIATTTVEVRCGGVRMGPLSKIELPKDWAKHPSTGKWGPLPGNDKATLTLAFDSKLQPSRLESSIDGLMERFFSGSFSEKGVGLADGLQCYMAGYGTNQKGTYGVLYTAKIDPQLLHLRDGMIILTESNGEELKTSAESGDSGGSLICEGENIPKTLIGVIISIDKEKKTTQNYFLPIWNK